MNIPTAESPTVMVAPAALMILLSSLIAKMPAAGPTVGPDRDGAGVRHRAVAGDEYSVAAVGDRNDPARGIGDRIVHPRKDSGAG